MQNGQDFACRAATVISHQAVRTDAHAVAEAHAALEHAIYVDRHVAPALERAAHIDARRIGERHARIEQRLGTHPLILPFQLRELALGVDPGRLPRIRGFDRDHRHAIADRETDEVGEVVLLLRVAVIDLLQPCQQPPRAQRVEAGIDLADAALGRGSVALLHDALARGRERRAPRGRRRRDRRAPRSERRARRAPLPAGA